MPQSVSSPTITASVPVTPSASASPTATVIPSASAPPSPTVPADWASYAPAGGGVTIRYPSGWYAIPGGGITSWDTTAWHNPQFPLGATKVDVLYGPTSQAEPRPSGAVDRATSAGDGWEAEYINPPDQANGVSDVHELTVTHGEKTLSLVAYYSAPEPTNRDAIFDLIASSISFQ